MASVLSSRNQLARNGSVALGDEPPVRPHRHQPMQPQGADMVGVLEEQDLAAREPARVDANHDGFRRVIDRDAMTVT